MKIFKAIGAGIGITVSFFYLGCGSVQIAEASHSSAGSTLTIATKQLPSAITGTPYIAALDATGGTPGYTWSVAGGQLPAGVSLTPSTGVISGTPTASGSFSVSLAVADSSSPALVKTSAFTVAVAPPALKISISSLPSATVGTPYSQTLQTSGGTAPYSWSITSGALPAGLTLTSSTGVISGTPTLGGTVKFTATVRDSGKPAQSYSTAMSITVAALPLKITTLTLPSVTSGAAYSQTLQASGGTPAYTWSISSGSLPSGLTLASTGTISGTPTSSGIASFVAAVSDHSTPVQTTSAAFTITVGNTPLTIATPALASGTVGSSYSQSLKALGGSAPYTWSIVSGSLPAGTTLTPSTGVISGVPTISGTSTFTAKVTDSSSPSQSSSISAKIVVAAPPLTVSATTLPSVTVGSAYSQTLQAKGGTAPYSWSLTSGSLPAGLSLASSGTIAGTPTTYGTFSFTATVTDSSNPVQTASASNSVTINATPLTVVPPTLPAVRVGTPYSKTLVASGGVGPYVWKIASGSLPQGLSLTPTAGTISGTPTTSGVSNFTAMVTDSGSPAQSAPASAAIVVSPTLLAITSSALTSTTVGASYSQTLTASGGSAPYTWAITSGALPKGLILSSSTGIISGTPTVAGDATFTATVTDSSNPAQVTSATNTISVTPTLAPPAITTPLVLSITTGSLPSLTLGTSYSQTLQASGGTSPYIWALAAGQLPAGLSLSSSGTISGVPTSSSAATFTVSVTDSGSPAQSQSANLTIASSASPLTITSPALLPGTSGTSYSQALSATGGTPAYSWSITSGSLPSGLTLAGTTGVISGMPTTTGTSTFGVSVHDNGNPVQTQSATVAITVSAPQSTNGPRTWYVDAAIGGTRYSSNQTAGLCDGSVDAAPVGTTPNQHCAFNDVRMLWQDGSYTTGVTFPSWGWIGSGGDTYIIKGSIADGISYRVGWNSPTQYCDYSNNPVGWCWGITGSPTNGPPSPPSGTASQHTRILGGNYGACTAKNARTQLHGGWGAGDVLNLSGTSYLDVACLDITDFSNCGKATDAISCTLSGPNPQDYATEGIIFNNQSTHITLTDIRVHGMALNGIWGPTGDGTVLTDIAIIGNAEAGWNADLGDGTTGVGSLLVQNFDISWNGCVEEYPIVDPLPYFSCTDDVHGGYGDGFGTSTVTSPYPGWQVHFDNGIASYNTQDGLDALHISGNGSTMTDTRVLAFGNEGNQLKVGGATATIQDSVIVANCFALSQVIPGRPVPTQDNIGDFCRAGNTAVLINVTPGDPATYQNNTMYSAGNVGLEVEYASGVPDPTDTLRYNNNVFVGFPNPTNSNQNPSPIYSNTDLNMLTNPGASWSNNVTYGQKAQWTCPTTKETNAICASPGLVDQTWHQYGYGNMAPASSSSPVVGAGVVVPGISTDYTGATRPNPPSIGAYELPQ